MSANALLLFGDQTGEVLPSIQLLSKHASSNQSLATFLKKSTDRLRHAISHAPVHQRRSLPTFNSLLELSTIVSNQQQSTPATYGALMCIAQLGHVIVHLERNPRALDATDDQLAITGLCIGLLAAAVVSCSRNLTEVLVFAEETVHLAFQVGLVASERSQLIDPCTGSWATLISQVDIHAIRDVIDHFNKNSALNESHRVYVSADSANSVTISGPPSTTEVFFTSNSILQNCKRISLPITAAFHAGHLQPIQSTALLKNVSPSLLDKTIQHPSLISSCSGLPYQGSTFGDLLVEILHDILQAPISLQACTQGLAKFLTPHAKLISFGPVNCAKTIQQTMQTHGVELRASNLHMLEKSPAQTANSVAIVGMSVRLPGSETLEEFWKVLEEGRDLHEKIRPDRFDVDTHLDSSGKSKNTSLTPYGVFIDRPGYFDTRLFNMSPREAAQTDPQQRLLLMTTYEALEMAGYTPNGTPSTNTKRIGSFMGQTGDDYREVNASQNVDTYFITGNIRAFGPGRLNYHFGWEGPSYSIDTACSSSAASIQLACSALLNREIDMAVGGGANFLSSSDLFAGLSRGSFLSKTGGCKTFDHDADGYVRADAVGVVVLKRLDDALSDRDNILAVIRGTATNHSAEASSITHPHAKTQERLFNSVLNQAGIDPLEIDYAELHGTGTQAGDATESRSVTNVLARNRPADNPLFIGTVKPNLGHGEAASGVTSLIKAIMMLRNNMIPPHIGIKGRINQRLPPLADLNTHISFRKTPFLARLGGDRKRKILINNFDAAGGNTSMVIEDPPLLTVDGVDPRKHQVVVVSGKTPQAVVGNSMRLLKYLETNPEIGLQDVAYTTTARRMHHSLRQAHAVSSVKALRDNLQRSIMNETWEKVPATPPQVVFLFTGQGSAYGGMASELFKTNQTFHELVQRYDDISVSHGFASFLPLIEDHHFDVATASLVRTQLAIVSIELAMAEYWKGIGVMPTAVIGHSLGEYPALCVAGVLSLSDCLYLVGKRASLMVSNCSPGTHLMLAIQASPKYVEELLEDMGTISGLEIACQNGPTSTVVSGMSEQIRMLQEKSRTKELKTSVLEVQYAFHSAQMNSILKEFREVASKVRFGPPSMPIGSTVFGSVVSSADIINAEYLCQGTRGPVRFRDAVEAVKGLMKPKQQAIWIETGPSPVCVGMLKFMVGPDHNQLLPSMKKGGSDWRVFTSSVARAFAAGLSIDWREFHRPYETSLRILELPPYAFNLKNYWIQYEGDWALRKGDPGEPFKSPITRNRSPNFSTTSLHRIESEVRDKSGVSVTFASDAAEPRLNTALRGHLVNGTGLCPSSVYADMAFGAASYIFGCTGSEMCLDVRNMEVHKPLIIQPGDTRQLIRVAATKKTGADQIEVSFASQDGQTHEDHASCIVVCGQASRWTSEWSRTAYLVKARIESLKLSSSRGETHRILRPMVYKLFTSLVDYDGRYQGLQEVFMESELFEAAANVKFNTTESDGTFTHSPYWLDSFAHLSGFVLNGAETTPTDAVFISHGWDSMRILGQLSADKKYQSYVRMQETSIHGVMEGDVYLFGGEVVVAVCQGLKFQRIQRSILDHLLPKDNNPGHPSSYKSSNASLQRHSVNIPTIKVELVEDRHAVPDFDEVLRLIALEVGVEIKELADDAVFADLGVDSLLSISITAKLGQLIRQSIPAGLFTEIMTVGDLRQYYFNNFDDDDSHSSFGGSTCGDPVFSQPESQLHTPFTDTGLSIGTPAEDRVNIIKKIIAAEIGMSLEEIDNDVPLIDFGVDSLLSLSIMAAIKAQTGQTLPSSFLMEHPTLTAIELAIGRPPTLPPQQLFKALEKVQQNTNGFRSEAVLLQGSPSSRESALFLLPDGSGSASSYVSLPKLGFPGPVWGLNSPFLDRPEAFTISLPDLASVFMTEIRNRQPRGPYRLAGWSVGGTYAYEAARQLIQHGEEVSSLTLIDAPCPASLPPLPIDTVSLLEKVGAFDGLRNKRRTLSTTMGKGVHAHFLGSLNALEKYKPVTMWKGSTPMIKSVTAIWARNGVWETVGLEVKAKHIKGMGAKNAARDWMMDTRSDFGPNGWEMLLPGTDIKCEVVDGDHFTIMRGSGVRRLGALLRDANKDRS
ncbi:putative polyketide synthase [Triangularia verruculosa]|uniref:Polyketide synthase n=1 Tax=Triangularia verruculosa TaxID=2587418 RepID=A0AAN7AVE0_9PEZI|nr:putative polyketide synthase [Triangularia verruculosa]